MEYEISEEPIFDWRDDCQPGSEACKTAPRKVPDRKAMHIPEEEGRY